LKRWPPTRALLLLLWLGLWLEASPASSQSTDSERLQTGPGTQTTVGSENPPRLQDPFSTATPPVGGELYRKALADFRAGKLDQAAAELKTLDSAASRNALGVVLETKGDQQGALSAFQDALKLQPDFAEAAYNAANLYMNQGRSSAAIYQLESALGESQGRNDNTYSLQMLLVQAYATAGQDKPAAKVLKKLLEERPDSAEVHLNLAITDAHLDLLDAASIQFRETLRLEPENTTALLGLAKVLLRLKDPAGARTYLQHYVRVKPNDPEGYFVLGCDWRDANESKQSAAAFAQAARLKPDDYDIKYHLGMALSHVGDLQAALLNLQSAKTLKPDDVQVHSALARVLKSLGKTEEARAESASAERLSARKARQSQADLHIVNGGLLLERSDLRGAAEEFRQALQFDPQSAPAHSNLGLVLSHLNDPEGARRELERAITLDPKAVLARNALGSLDMQEGKVADAQAAFTAAIRINPQYAEAKNNLGTLDAEIGKNAEAVALFAEAVEDAPRYPQAYLNWGLVLASQGDLSGAKPKLEKALQLSPNLAQAQKALEYVNRNLKGPS
jgi:Flp pilus assembly protein TadD